MNEDVVIQETFYLCKNGYFLTKEMLRKEDNIMGIIRQAIRNLGDDPEWHYSTTSEPKYTGICSTVEEAVEKVEQLVGY